MAREIKHKVLVVEDDTIIRKLLVAKLEEEGFQVVACENGKSALELSPSTKPDIVLLDLIMPDISGRDVLKALRRWCKAPILIVSSESEDSDVVELLKSGADDYVFKPFNFQVLLARINANLRKSVREESGDTELINGDLRLDQEKHLVFLRGEKVYFTPKEYALLKYFLVNRGKILTHRDILRDVWGAAHSKDVQYLRTYVGQLRNKIEKDPASPVIILNEPGIGYRMEQFSPSSASE